MLEREIKKIVKKVLEEHNLVANPPVVTVVQYERCDTCLGVLESLTDHTGLFDGYREHNMQQCVAELSRRIAILEGM